MIRSQVDGAICHKRHVTIFDRADVGFYLYHWRNHVRDLQKVFTQNHLSLLDAMKCRAAIVMFQYLNLQKL